MAEIPEKKKGALGVHAMKLTAGDEVEEGYLVTGHKELDIEYRGKKISLNKIRLMKRDSRGTRVKV